MKTFKYLLGLGLLALPMLALAQDAPEGSEAVGGILAFFSPLLEAAAGKYGWVVTIFVVMGVLRAVMKPIFSIVEAIVVATPGKDDDKFLADMKAHAVYKWIAWILDYLASVKLPKAKE